MTTTATKKPDALSGMKARVKHLEKELADCLEGRTATPKQEPLEQSPTVTPLSKKHRALIVKLVSDTIAANSGAGPGDEYDLAKYLIGRLTRGIKSAALKTNICIHFYRLLYKKATALHERSSGGVSKANISSARALRKTNRDLDGMIKGTYLILTVYLIRRNVLWGESLERPKVTPRPKTID